MVRRVEAPKHTRGSAIGRSVPAWQWRFLALGRSLDPQDRQRD
jgi:hypothetical protein